ncbi:hypothetical protein IWQ56_000263 [Coemansia nantahalensis]|nr:hypothetical protein IWQ56_000263 [Coemansia nantahalensis]
MMSISRAGVMLAMALALALPAVHAHTYVATVTLGGKEQPEGKCIRPWWKNENYPQMDLDAQDMLCRTENMDPSATDICPVAAGSTVQILWTESGKGSRAIDPEHPGPCFVYMSPMEANGKGNVWFKIAEEGYDPKAKRWCTRRMYDEGGIFEVTIPADLKPGNYIMRPELISLHEADRVYGDDKSAGAQYYPNCIQLKVTGSGTVVPPGVAIPGIYKKNDPGIHFNLWDDDPNKYPFPGPPVYKSGSAKGTGGDPPKSGCTKRKARKRQPVARRQEM